MGLSRLVTTLTVDTARPRAPLALGDMLPSTPSSASPTNHREILRREILRHQTDDSFPGKKAAGFGNVARNSAN